MYSGGVVKAVSAVCVCVCPHSESAENQAGVIKLGTELDPTSYFGAKVSVLALMVSMPGQHHLT